MNPIRLLAVGALLAALAERLAWRVFLTHRDRLPTVYKGNASLMVWIGHTYLDVFAASGDERFKEAALNLARTLAAQQHPDGGWPGEKAPWPGGVFGPSEFRTNGADHFKRSTEDTDQTAHTYDAVEAARCLTAAADLLVRGRPGSK
jgi:hypothetical protein